MSCTRTDVNMKLMMTDRQTDRQRHIDWSPNDCSRNAVHLSYLVDEEWEKVWESSAMRITPQYTPTIKQSMLINKWFQFCHKQTPPMKGQNKNNEDKWRHRSIISAVRHWELRSSSSARSACESGGNFLIRVATVMNKPSGHGGTPRLGFWPACRHHTFKGYRWVKITYQWCPHSWGHGQFWHYWPWFWFIHRHPGNCRRNHSWKCLLTSFKERELACSCQRRM